jgi:hypothetical protein
MEKKNTNASNVPVDIIELWHQSRLSLTDKYVVSPEILKVHDSAIATLGNFSASIGKAKSKKTFNVSAIVAAVLKPLYLTLAA